jgi:hypothetical protein
MAEVVAEAASSVMVEGQRNIPICQQTQLSEHNGYLLSQACVRAATRPST